MQQIRASKIDKDSSECDQNKGFIYNKRKKLCAILTTNEGKHKKERPKKVLHISVHRNRHLCFHKWRKKSLKHDRRPPYDTQLFKSNPKDPVHNRLVYLELMTTLVNATRAKALTTIKKKDYMQYPIPMKGKTRKRDPKSTAYFTKKSVML